MVVLSACLFVTSESFLLYKTGANIQKKMKDSEGTCI